MKRFKFRLEKVLNFRLSIKRERERELQQENYRLAQANAQLQALEASARSNDIAQNQIQNAEIFLLQGDFREWSKRAIEVQRRNIQDQEERVEKARVAYIDAAREAEVLEKLKAKRKQNHYEESLRVEQLSMDEISVQRLGYERGRTEEKR